MAVKKPLRDLSWILKGANLRNPPLPEKVGSILFVCLGNICRSPFAEKLVAERVKGIEPRISCASAGIRTTQAGRSPAFACEVARTFGVTLDAHRPQTLTRELVDAHDLIVVMEAAHLLTLRASYPNASDRIVLLSLLDSQARPGYDRYNIADPFSRPREAFEACYQRIEHASSNLLSAIHRRDR
jgi:protein-tyrosine phosphatase